MPGTEDAEESEEDERNVAQAVPKLGQEKINLVIVLAPVQAVDAIQLWLRV